MVAVASSLLCRSPTPPSLKLQAASHSLGISFTSEASLYCSIHDDEPHCVGPDDPPPPNAASLGFCCRSRRRRRRELRHAGHDPAGAIRRGAVPGPRDPGRPREAVRRGPGRAAGLRRHGARRGRDGAQRRCPTPRAPGLRAAVGARERGPPRARRQQHLPRAGRRRGDHGGQPDAAPLPGAGHAERAHRAGRRVPPPREGVHDALAGRADLDGAAVRRPVPRRLRHGHREAAAPVPPRHGRAIHGQRLPLLRPHQRHARHGAVPPGRRRRSRRRRHRARVRQRARRAARRRALGDPADGIRRRRHRRVGDRVAVGRGGLGARRRRRPRQGLQQERHPAPRVRRRHPAHAQPHLRGLHLLPLRREPQAGASVAEELRPLPRRHDAGLRRRHLYRSGGRCAGEHESDPGGGGGWATAMVRAEAGGGRDDAAGEHRLRVRARGHRLRRHQAGRRLLRAQHGAGPRRVRHEPLFPLQRPPRVQLRLRADGHCHYGRSQLWWLQIHVKKNHHMHKKIYFCLLCVPYSVHCHYQCSIYSTKQLCKAAGTLALEYRATYSSIIHQMQVLFGFESTLFF